MEKNENISEKYKFNDETENREEIFIWKFLNRIFVDIEINHDKEFKTIYFKRLPKCFFLSK